MHKKPKGAIVMTIQGQIVGQAALETFQPLPLLLWTAKQLICHSEDSISCRDPDFFLVMR